MGALGPVLRWLLSRGSWVAAGWFGKTAIDAKDEVGSSLGAATRVGMAVSVGAGAHWVFDRVVQSNAFGGGKKRDLALAAASLGVGLLTYKATKSEPTPSVSGDLGCAQLENVN